MSEKTEKRCLYCNEMINTDAVKCKHCGSTLQAPPDFSPFEVIDLPLVDIPVATDIVVSSRYEIMKELGRGGMGVVFLAHDRELDVEVAVKFLLVEFAGDQRALDALRSEARLAMSLAHPNIVRLHTLEISGRSKFLVMEYVEGPSLANLLGKKDKLPLDEVIRYMHDACVALDYAHSEGIIHRDIKPANFLLSSKGTLKLTDFGIARKVRQTMSQVTQKVIMGTPYYMSPEHIMGRKIDHRSDIYSLGALVYELLTGLPPFVSGCIETQIILKPPDPIEGIPKHVNDAVLKALRKSPPHRWQSATDFHQALVHGMPQVQAVAEPTLRWPDREIAPVAETKRLFRILVVDDEEDIRMSVRTVLTKKGYEVDTAVDGQDALNKIAEATYDLVVLDILMPHVDGIQALSRLRNAGLDIPVLMLTALDDDRHILESYRSGANHYMVKPFSTKKLVAASRYLVGDFTEKERPDIERALR